jgi:hypothetical protein
MLKQFYEKALPRQGVYCVSGLDPQTKKLTNRFAETLDDVFVLIKKTEDMSHNVYVALGTFDGYSRKAEDCLFYRSFFLDLDVGEDKAAEGKGYLSKEDALASLENFVSEVGLPPPLRLDSGIGIHAYWLLDEDVPIDEYLPYAKKFKALCVSKIISDPSVIAEPARIMRCPYTLNYRAKPPALAHLIDEEITSYSFESFKEFLGEIAPSSDDIMASLPKGLDEETRQMLKLDNFKFSFAELAHKSVTGNGCEQIRYMLENQPTVPRDQWAAGLTIAIHCEDGSTAIHEMSNEHPEYDYQTTEKTANSFDGPRTCDWFISNFPEQCEGCKHRGKIKTPIVLGREFHAAAPSSEEKPIWEEADSQSVSQLPEFLRPFIRGANGGIYYVPPPERDKKGQVVHNSPVLVTAHDLVPVRRTFSPIDGEGLTMRLILPHDAPREFLVPLKVAASLEKLKEIMVSNGVLCDPAAFPYLMSYVIKWGQYMVNTAKAEIMRMQMGWTEDNKAFVIGQEEITHEGLIIPSAYSPYVKGIAKFLVPKGNYAKWRECVDMLNLPGLEMLALPLLAGFGSPLMRFTSTSGVVISLNGKSGCGKTGALYAGLSVFGSPENLSVYDSTDNGLVMRMLGMRSLLFGLDEVGNKDGRVLSSLTHGITQGRAKIRMQASVNAEREHELKSSLIAIYTTNHSIYQRFVTDKGSPEGETARVIEFNVLKPEIFMSEQGGKLGRQIFDPLRTNYGHAGRMYVPALYKLGDSALSDLTAEWGERFSRDFGGDSAYRFYENFVAASFAGGQIAVRNDIIGLDIERIYDNTIMEMIRIRDRVTKDYKVDYSNLLSEFLNANIGNTLVIKDQKVVHEPRNALVARCCSDECLIQVSKAQFDDMLNKKSISTSEFEAAMKKSGTLIDIKVGRLAKGWKSAPSNSPARLYWFRSTLTPDLLDAADANT